MHINLGVFKMKKMFKSLVIGLAALGLVAGYSYAGSFNVDDFGAAGGIDFDGTTIHNGVAGGIGAAGGVAGGQAAGGGWGSVGGKVGITVGGATTTEAYDFYTPIADWDGNLGITNTVGSTTNGFATTNGSTDINSYGLTAAESTMFGAAGQGTLNGSALTDPDYIWNSTGFSGGVAGQGSAGGFVGLSGSAIYGEVALDAGMTFNGGSGSESWRSTSINWKDNTKTEAMGTNVGAYTDVISHGDVNSYALATGFVEGGYVAGGGAAAKTVQQSDVGYAAANASGSYSGSGSLGSNYTGSANGFTATSITTFKGMNGSVVTSQAGMQVVDYNN